MFVCVRAFPRRKGDLKQAGASGHIDCWVLLRAESGRCWAEVRASSFPVLMHARSLLKTEERRQDIDHAAIANRENAFLFPVFTWCCDSRQTYEHKSPPDGRLRRVYPRNSLLYFMQRCRKTLVALVVLGMLQPVLITYKSQMVSIRY